MKIYHINVVANSGSTGHIAEGIIRAAKNEGYENYMAYGRWANSSSGILYKIGNLWEIFFHVLITRFYDYHGMGSYFATKRLIKNIKSINPDIIHLHNIHGYYLNYPLLFQYLSEINIPIVWTLHDCWAYTGHCVHYTDINCNRWKNKCYSCPNLKDYPHSFLKDSSTFNYLNKKKYFTNINNLTIVTVSNWLLSQVKESFLKRYKAKTIYNGINLNKFTPQKIDKKVLNLQEKFIILGIATVWSNRKGLDDFIKLAKILTDNELIILVGLNKKQMVNLPSNILGIEKTENIQKLVELYSVADIFINFSTEETFGMTTIESMACGTPVIVVNSTASPEIVNTNVGFIIEPHDILAAKNKILLMKNIGKHKYSAKCRAYVEDKYNEFDRFKEYIDLYKALLGK